MNHRKQVLFPLCGLSTSGGDFVVLNLIHKFLDHGYYVYILTSQPICSSVLADYFGVQDHLIVCDMSSFITYLFIRFDFVVSSYFITSFFAFPFFLVSKVLLRNTLFFYLIQGKEYLHPTRHSSKFFSLLKYCLVLLTYYFPFNHIYVSHHVFTHVNQFLPLPLRRLPHIFNPGISAFFTDSLQYSIPFSKPTSQITALAIFSSNRIKGPDSLINLLEYLVYNSRIFMNIIIIDSTCNFPSSIQDLINQSKFIKLSILGFQSPFDLSKLMSSSDIFISTSLSEGFGLPGLEAMSSGCILFSSDNGGCNDYLVHGYNGFIFKSPTHFLTLLTKLYNSKSLIKSISDSSIITARSFSIESRVSLMFNHVVNYS